MTNEHTGFSRRKLLKAGAVGVPTAGLLAFGSTLVTAAPANTISADGWWGSETSAGFQRFMNTVMGANLIVDGVISSQDAAMQTWCPGIVGGWEWVESGKAEGSPTIHVMNAWLDGVTPKQYAGFDPSGWKGSSKIGYGIIKRLQGHYGISQDGRLDAPSRTIQALQNEINQYV